MEGQREASKTMGDCFAPLGLDGAHRQTEPQKWRLLESYGISVLLKCSLTLGVWYSVMCSYPEIPECKRPIPLKCYTVYHCFPSVHADIYLLGPGATLSQWTSAAWNEEKNCAAPYRSDSVVCTVQFRQCGVYCTDQLRVRCVHYKVTAAVTGEMWDAVTEAALCTVFYDPPPCSAVQCTTH